MTQETPATAPPFGEAMERLEAIVARLEGDESLGLEEALTLYQQGVGLAGECRRRLAGAQLAMTELTVRPPDGDGPAGPSETGGAGEAESGADAAPTRGA